MDFEMDFDNASEHPLENDVVYGRGGLANNHNGNKRFRTIVDEFKKQYENCSRHEKTALAEALVRNWREQSPPGRFLKFNDLSGLWEDVGKKARSKCSQLLREGAPKMRKGSKRDGDDPPKKHAPKGTSDDSTDSTKNVSEVPPPPPLESPLATDAPCDTPPKKKITAEFKSGSPCSVMNMPFYGVGEQEEKDQPAGGSRCDTFFSGVFDGLRIPGRPCRRTAERVTSNKSRASEDNHPDAEPSALRSFLTNMLREKAVAIGAGNISIFQDNASASPVRPKPDSVKKEIVEQSANPLLVNSGDLGSDIDSVALGVNQPIKASAVPPPRRISSSKRNTTLDSRSLDIMSMEICVQKPFGLAESEHSMSLKSVDMELEDDPILNKYASMGDSSHHSSTTRSRLSTCSVDSKSSSITALLEDLGFLFRDRGSSADTGSSSAAMSALFIFETELQPELDDMSFVSGGTLPWADCNGLDGGTRHSALSIDSATLDELMEGLE